MKKLTCLLLTLAMLLSISTALAATGDEGLGYGFNPTGERIVDDEITVKVLYQRNTRHGDFNNYWFIDYVAEKTGIRLEFELVETAAWNERVSIAFATDDYPDVFMNGMSTTIINKYAEEGYLVNLEPLIKKYAPFTVSEYNKYPELVKEVYAADGGIYYIPSINASPRDLVTTYPSWINAQWLKNLNLEMPTTLDELYTVLKAIKTQDANLDGDPNNEIPVVSSNGGKFSTLVISSLGYVDNRNAIADDRYVYVPTTETYKAYLKWMNRFYSEGLLDNEYFTSSGENLRAKESTGLAAMIDMTPYEVLAATYEEFKGLSPLTSDLNQTKMWPAQSACRLSWGTCVVTDKCQYPEAIVRLIDWFYTVDGSRAVRAGCEYGTWKDEQGVEYGWEIVTPADQTADGHLIAKLHMGDYSSYWACRLGEIGPTNLPFNSTDAVNDIIIAGDKMNLWLYNQVMDSGVVAARTFSLPQLSFTDDESTRKSVYLDLTNYVDNMESKFIKGDLDIDANWEDFQAQLQKYDVNGMCEIYQAALDRYNARPGQITVD